VRLLSAYDDVEIVGVAVDLPQLLAAVDEHAPNVVLTDIRMPPSGTDEGFGRRPNSAPATPTWASSCCRSTSSLGMR
jgi:DNA-binding NarL/FixJ family response regulator